MKVRPDAQLLLAIRAPPRPDLGAAGDKERRRALQCEWVASWGGRPLAAGASDAQQISWWKQAKKQHGELVEAARRRFGDGVPTVPSADNAPPAGQAGPVPVAGLTLTQSWVEQHAPEIVELRVEVEDAPDGGELRHVRARVEGPDGEEEHVRSVYFSPRHDEIDTRRRRRREERAVLALASLPRRRRLQEYIEYEEETAVALAAERREMERRLRQLERASLRPFTMQSGGGRVLWLPAARLEELGPFDEPYLDNNGVSGGVRFATLAPAEKETYLERGCFLCGNQLFDCWCGAVRLSPPAPPCCPSPLLCAADGGRQCGTSKQDEWLGPVPWCTHRSCFRARRRGGLDRPPWRGMQRRWLASDGSSAARDALLAEWSALDFSEVQKRTVQCAAPAEETRWVLRRSAEERAAEAAAAEAAEADDWAWMLQDVVRSSDFLADLGADMCTRWRQEIALPRYAWRHCWHCGKGEAERGLGVGRFVSKGTPMATGATLVLHEQPRAAAAAAAAAKRVCAKAASQEHSWTWTIPRAQRAEQLRRLPDLVVCHVSELEQKAELAEAWAAAFEARWGHASALAAGVRDAVLRARENVERMARVRDDMELLAREKRVGVKVRL